MHTMPVSAPPFQWTEPCLPGDWRVGRWISFENGHPCQRMSSWPIGSGPGDRSRWFPSRLSHKMEVMTYLPAVVGVAVVGNYRLRLLFDDGTVGDVDFSAEEWPGVFEPLRDPGY